MPRVRHHTDDVGSEQIRRSASILPARGIEGVDAGVHVEVEPFGSARPGLAGPQAELGSFAGGAFVEFDSADNMVLRTAISPRNVGMIPTGADQPFSLVGRNPRYVRVRRYWWELWRTRME